MSNNNLDIKTSSVKYNNFNDDRDEENGAVPQQRAVLPATAKPANNDNKITIIGAVLILGVFLLICLSLGFGISNRKVIESTVTGRLSGIGKNMYPSSCQEVQKLTARSGIFTIQPPFSKPYDVYCDMTSAGGGWTMVASFNEDNINSRCSRGDTWSYSPNTYRPGLVSWENLNTFGDVNAATSNDYKSPAYSNLKATDVMLWHVPNNVPLQDIADKAFYKYYTTSKFLATRGKSIQQFFSRFAPLKKLTMKNIINLVAPCFESFISPGVADSIRNGSYIPNASALNDQISFKVNDQPYVKISTKDALKRSSTPGIELWSKEGSLPKLFLAWISNEHGNISSFTLKVNRSDEGMRRGRYYSTVRRADTTFYYKHACDRTFDSCKVIFAAINSKKWNPNTPSVFINDTSPSNVTITLRRSVGHVLVGYVFTSMKWMSRSSTSSVISLFRNVSNCFAKIDYMKSLNVPDIYTPVNFLKGDMSNYEGNIIPGFLQFRAYDTYGFPHAFCPGVRMKNESDPALHCVGAAPPHYSLASRCGDFAGWEKLPEHHKVRAPGPKGYVGGTITDLTSTILMFARDSDQ